ncbi:ATP-binding protein [Heyndrickxia sporothermodurans]|uniref:ATP-binding protein n=1 Tax=Heyndrickxia sporothermodurans TaxID=46224 RepID=UPI002E2216FB|nr:ATP-binding protein [Heyndrickxia sporothermodurans]MED3649999.1 ATP-binding protein [Heyndrickxia sporothermodurans]MED3697985.1 ATP-binding protein [Heyndrickxia sporothermodurans]
MKTNEQRCLLANGCKVAGTAQCNDNCSHFIAIHGRSGNGGRVAAAGTPADYRLLTLANSPARESQAKVYRVIADYVATFERQFEADAPRIKSLYLYSESPGTGKTTTASMVLNEWIRRHYIGSLKRNQQPLQVPAYFLDINEWQTEYNLATMTNDDSAMAKIKATIQRTQQTPFLVIDDVGVRSASEAFRSYVHAIINHRTANGLPTVYTSNLPIEDMARVFDARLYDRMRDQCAFLEFGGESKRGRR